MNYIIHAPEEVQASVTMPVSKSQVARETVIRALCGATPIPKEDADACDDTRVITRALSGQCSMPNAQCPMRDAQEAKDSALNSQLSTFNSTSALNSQLSTFNSIDCGLSATALRLLTAYYASQPGYEVRLTGEERLLQRPMKGLLDAIEALGGHVEVLDDKSLLIKGTRLTGGSIEIDADVSSQYITALMLVAPYMEAPLSLRLRGAGISEGYWRMTAAIMARYGIEPEIEGMTITVPTGAYDTATPWRPEGDWSCAGYWYELEAITMGDIVLQGLRLDSPQPDAATPHLWEALGILTNEKCKGENEKCHEGTVSLEPSPEQWARLTGDMSGTPDAVPALVVACVCLGIPLHLWGLEHLRHKESDRLECLRLECLKLGVGLAVDSLHGTLEWDGARQPVQLDPLVDAQGSRLNAQCPSARGKEIPGTVVIDPHGDHRLAMAFAPVAWYIDGLVIKDAGCVNKSYPLFWQHLREAGFVVES